MSSDDLHSVDSKAKVEDISSAKKVKSDEHAPKTSKPHDSMLMEHDAAMSGKHEFPHLAIPHFGPKAGESAEPNVEKVAAKSDDGADKVVHAKSKDAAEQLTGQKSDTTKAKMLSKDDGTAADKNHQKSDHKAKVAASTSKTKAHTTK